MMRNYIVAEFLNTLRYLVLWIFIWLVIFGIVWLLGKFVDYILLITM